MLNWYDWHTVSERLQGRLYALTRGKPFSLRLDPQFPTGYCDLEKNIVGINPVAFNDVFAADGLDGAELDEANFLMSRALTGHEALHTEFTDSNALIEACRQMDTKNLWNILEDARIEGIGAEQSHVSKLLFKLLKRSLIAEMPEFNDPNCDDPASWFYLLMRWRCGIRIPDISDGARKIWRQVRTLAESSLYAEDSWEVLQAAREIAKVTGIDKPRDKSEMDQGLDNVMDKASSGMNGNSKPKPNPRQKPDPNKNEENGQDSDDGQSQPDSEQDPQAGNSESEQKPDAGTDGGDPDTSGEQDADDDGEDEGEENPEDPGDEQGDTGSSEGDSDGNDSSGTEDSDGTEAESQDDSTSDGEDEESGPDSSGGPDEEDPDPSQIDETNTDQDQSTGGNSGAGGSDEDEDEEPEEPLEDLKDLLKSVADQVQDKLADSVPQGDPHKLLEAKGYDRTSSVVAAPYIHLLDKAVPVSQAIRRELKGENPKAETGPSKRAGRFKARYYIRDAEKPFAKAQHRGMKVPEMALTLILDRSGSMEGYMDGLRIMAMAIYLVCEQLQIPLSIWALEGRVHLKRFDEQGPQVLAKIAGLEAETLTKMMPTIREACDDLEKRPEDLKQIVLIHDGQPHDRELVTEWSQKLGFGLFCMYVMPDEVYEQTYVPNRRGFEELMGTLFGQRRYAIARMKDMSKFWCSYMRTKRRAYSVPV